ncbi:PREDICTED: uncharacterized protein LOC109337945 [Lupinus angustifolius]|uniref:uncharacterized protein LOC109337945 n=1 Tax=Lupinus angustifolius TaxID=3871 RepID=UPI00092EC04C|nr:PREDICTED: uncharacterized protein LOC109337945 [Lupinus angustifolius]
MSRLDRFLLSPDWLNAWPNSTQWAINREFSDHCPVILRYKKLEKGPIPFKFNNCWLHHPSFAAVVSNSWANSDVVGKWAFIIKEKLKHLKKDIKVWNKECFGCLDPKLGVLVSDIQAIDLIGEATALDANQIADRKTLQAEWWKTTSLKDSLLRQKSRSKWLKEGDANTSYFHACINNKRRRNNIMGLWIDGTWCEEGNLIRRGVLDYFKSLFSHVPSTNPTLDGVEFRRLSDVQRSGLDVAFLEEEIRLAVWSCAGDKSPGPDGFNFKTSNFFKIFGILSRRKSFSLFRSSTYQGGYLEALTLRLSL